MTCMSVFACHTIEQLSEATAGLPDPATDPSEKASAGHFEEGGCMPLEVVIVLW